MTNDKKAAAQADANIQAEIDSLVGQEPEQYGPPAPGQTVIAIPTRWVRVTHHSPDHIAARYPYAGYGSNLSLSQMGRRCSMAEIMGAGTLPNARIVFAYHMGVVADDQASVPVGVYRVTAPDVAALDRYEGLGRNYERFLVTVQMGDQMVRCFTYLKRNNDLEEPSDQYYATCAQGYADWQFDTRRLRHARDHARKHGRKRASPWSFENWYGANYPRRGNQSAHIPNVPTVDGSGNDNWEPESGNGTAASYNPRISLVSGRDLNKRREKRIEDMRPDEIRQRFTPPTDDPTRVSIVNGKDQNVFIGRNGARWRKGKNGVWYPAKED